MSRFFSDSVRDSSYYTPGEQPSSGDVLKLNTNEHAICASGLVTSELGKITADQLRRYPDPYSSELRQTIAQNERLSIEQVFVGNGSDDVLAHAWQAFLSNKLVIAPDITYGFYPVWADRYGSQFTTIALRPSFEIDLCAFQENQGAVVLANPNAPTGIALSVPELESIIAINQDRFILIDEAYYGFGASSASSLIGKYDNLLIVRSLSKSHALAGLRVGYALGHPELISSLNLIKDSVNAYPLDIIAQNVARAALRDSVWYAHASSEIMTSRSKLSAGLLDMEFRVLPSKANFVFVEHARLSGRMLFRALRDANILVRRWDIPRIENWLRISIGTPKQTQQILFTLGQLLNQV